MVERGCGGYRAVTRVGTGEFVGPEVKVLELGELYEVDGARDLIVGQVDRSELLVAVLQPLRVRDGSSVLEGWELATELVVAEIEDLQCTERREVRRVAG